MILKSFLLIINCFGYKNDPNAYDLLMFGLGSFAIISILLFYYSKIPKSNFKENDIQTERKISRLPKMILYLSILVTYLQVLI